MATPREIIVRALRLIERIGATESAPDANDEDVCRLALNDLIDEWHADGLMLFGITRQVGNLVAGQSLYVIDIAGDIDIPTPVDLQGVGIILDPSATTPVETSLGHQSLTQEEYQAIPMKDLPGVPRRWWYNRQAWHGELTLWPVPDSSTYDVAVYVRTQIYEIGTGTGQLPITTEYDLPPGYRRAMVYGLAVAIAPLFGVPVTPEIAAIAAEAKRTVKHANYRPSELRFPAYFGGARSFDYRTGN